MLLFWDYEHHSYKIAYTVRVNIHYLTLSVVIDMNIAIYSGVQVK